jgi:hypothetical protein
MINTGGRPSGFDYLRLLLALFVVWGHTAEISYGQNNTILWDMPFRLIMRPVLPMFFALSGFLVAGSLERNPSQTVFLGLRILRIYPALMVEVLIAALIIGPLLTSVPLADYFTDAKFFHYLVNVTGHISYLLPGVFEHNPVRNTVNVQLWTVRFELACYILLSLLMLCKLLQRRYLALVLNAALILYIVASKAYTHAPDLAGTPECVTGSILVAHFLAGLTFYLYRRELPWSPVWGMIATIIGVALLTVVPYGEYIASLPVAYMTVWLGLGNPHKLAVLKGADYSYGIFLYGALIQQCIAAIFPWSHEWWINFLLSFPIIVIIAAASWHIVEKPALAWRTYLPVIDVALKKRFSKKRS